MVRVHILQGEREMSDDTKSLGKLELRIPNAARDRNLPMTDGIMKLQDPYSKKQDPHSLPWTLRRWNQE